jgi:hypothetical protein
MSDSIDRYVETKEFEVRCSPVGQGGVITKKVKYDIYERPGKDYLVYRRVYEPQNHLTFEQAQYGI